jgi:hypothetical protein
MKTKDKSPNVIDATSALRRPAVKPLKMPELQPGQWKVLDAYIAARRRQAAAEDEANGLKPAVLDIVKVHQQVARKGAVVRLSKLYEWKYGDIVTGLAKTLADEREHERESGIALATVNATVAFEDVRAKERARRERMRAG